jgi:hypothetical protein
MRQLGGGIRHSKRRGRTDPPEPSQSCTSPAPPSPSPHMSFCPGTVIIEFQFSALFFFLHNDTEVVTL